MTEAFGLKQMISNIPPLTLFFLKRAFIIFVVWKLIYHLILFPINVPDRQLTQFTAVATGEMLTAFSGFPELQTREEIKEGHLITVLYDGSKKLLGVANSCNGLELIILYIAFLFCLPASLSRQITFLIVGTIGILLLNIVRCYGLALLFINNYAFADFAHKYLFKMVVYAAIFFGWVWFSKKLKHV